MESLEITSIVCNFCNEPISGEVIKPCRCDNFYHSHCLQHIQNLNEDPLLMQKCETCHTTYNTRYKNTYDRCIYKYFTFHSRRLYYNYFAFGLLGTLISIIVDSCLDSVFLGVSLGCLSYSILVWGSISYANYHYNLLNNNFPIFSLCLSLILIISNTYYTKNWFDWATLALTSALITRTKSFLFVLSSYYPYLIIENYYPSTNDNDL